ncbi:MAG: proline/glycine betaine ABC transporter permease [Desulfovibrio sp.]|nr:proline/glycine betaine ABC transporter permease [Desulfovibrio sp.]MCA1985980.1 proline/glycine betaine ABC transporter permease [Desulfovibrio sp.]
MSWRVPLGTGIEALLDWCSTHFAFATKAFSVVAGHGLALLERGLLWLPPWAFLLLAVAGIWRLTRRPRLALVSAAGLGLIWNLGLWSAMVSTLALVSVATCLAIGLGIPLGIAAAMSRAANKTIMPVLDMMQTMPAFVYLIPAIPFFGLGKVAAIFSTVIFSMPPAIRLTCLGITQTPRELVECAEAFGSSRWQKLVKLQLPLAAPTIMAGVNQTVMLALSMVVIAAMIGAKGLGGEVWKAIQRLEMGSGFEAGICIVVVAVILDRILQRVGRSTQA